MTGRLGEVRRPCPRRLNGLSSLEALGPGCILLGEHGGDALAQDAPIASLDEAEQAVLAELLRRNNSGRVTVTGAGNSVGVLSRVPYGAAVGARRRPAST